jgi:dihydrofolate synthase / folylpolyglutamate synthase
MPDHATSTDPAVQAQLDRLTMLSPGRDVLGLERIAALMRRLGNPHRALPPVFHIAGTNGKGSTTAFLRAMLEAGGHRVHAYTSPHLVRFNERIRVAGRLIDDATLAPLLAEVLDCSTDIAPSFFEATTAAAFLAFTRTPADACVIEVGLGGRLDATNIIERPLVTGIASLGLDHAEFLLAPDADVPAMSDLERIAFEKAGIAKRGVPLVTQAYQEGISARIADVAANVGAIPAMRDRHWTARPIGRGFAFADTRGKFYADAPALPGPHQQDNAVLALAMLRNQPLLTVSDAAINRGIRAAQWPARMQRLGDGPLTRLTPAGTTTWLDGGHNPNAGQAIAAMLAQTNGPVHLIIGMLRNKNSEEFLRRIAPHIASLHAVPIAGHVHHDPKDLCALAQKTFGIIDADPVDSVTTALMRLPPSVPTTVLICGSLYLAGEVLRLNGELPS